MARDGGMVRHRWVAALVKGSPEHARYLRSRAWKALRLAVFKRDGYRCEDCGCVVFDMSKLDCHHKRYERLGCERLSDLGTKCKRCHRRVSTW